MKKDLTAKLSRCKCCPRQCGANRFTDRYGICRMGADIKIAHAGLHFGEEPPISGTNGSGTVFFLGCNLRCVFCQNYQISQEFERTNSRTLTVDELASEMVRLQDAGAHNINFVSPSHMIFQMADAIDAARKKGLRVPVVYNSNGYDSVQALRQIHGLVDIYLPDMKYLDNRLGKKLSGVEDYADVFPHVFEEMLDQVGHLELDEYGIAKRGLLVRHLVIPGYLENSLRCLEFLAGYSRHVFLSIMSQYAPRYRAFKYPEINRTLSQDEYNRIIDYALDLGLENAFIQEIESHGDYLPDFTKESPFNAPHVIRPNSSNLTIQYES